MSVWVVSRLCSFLHFSTYGASDLHCYFHPINSEIKLGPAWADLSFGKPGPDGDCFEAETLRSCDLSGNVENLLLLPSPPAQPIDTWVLWLKQASRTCVESPTHLSLQQLILSGPNSCHLPYVLPRSVVIAESRYSSALRQGRMVQKSYPETTCGIITAE